MDTKKIIAVVIVAVIVIAGAGVYLMKSSDNSQSRELLTTTLQVYGNANGDWTIDGEDTSFIQEIIDKNADDDTTNDIDWSNDYPFADSDHNGIVNSKDITQAEALSNSTATHVCFLDGLGEFMDVGCDPKRIYAFQIQNAELCAIMGAGDNVVAGGPPIQFYADLLFGEGKSDTLDWFSSDWERMAELDLDMYLVFSPTQKAEPTEKLPGVDVVYLGLYEPDCLNLSSSVWAQGILEAGYIFNCKEHAEGYLNFLLEIVEKLSSTTATIASEDKVDVLASGYAHYLYNEDDKTVTAYLKSDTISQAVALAGGHNVADSLAVWNTTYSTTVEAEWLSEVDIDWITMHFQKYAWTGLDSTMPYGGYTVTEYEGMYDAIDRVAERELISEVDSGKLIMLPQENRNGCQGGVLTAAYLAKAFYPDLYADFDPDALMEEYLTVWMNLEDYDYDAHEAAMVGYGDRYTDD